MIPKVEFPPPEDLQPWDQQPEESPEAFQAFQFYRDAGDDRTARMVADALGKNISLIGRWSSRHAWRSRIWALTLHEDRLRRQQLREQIEKMRVRQAKQAQALQGFGMQGLKAYSDAWQRELERTAGTSLEPEFPTEMIEAARIIESGMKMELIAMGEPPEPQGGERDQDARDDMFTSTLLDPDVRDATKRLVRAAEAARARESGGVGSRDESELSPPEAPGDN